MSQWGCKGNGFFYSSKIFLLILNLFYKKYALKGIKKGNNQTIATYRELFCVFAKIGAFTLGGGYAMISLIEKEVVTKRGWISKDEFDDILIIAQSSPGLLAVNISIFVGYKLRGNRGSFIATLGTIIPSFFMILLIALFFSNYKDNIYVDKFFKGVRPAVVALIALPVVNMLRRHKLSIWKIIITIATFALIVFIGVSPIYILLIALVGFAIYSYLKHYKYISD